MPRPIPVPIRQTMFKLWKQGCGTRQIVASLGLPCSTVRRLLQRFRLRGCDGIAEYRVEIHTGHPLPELRVLVEPKSECGDVAGLEKRLQSALRTALGLRIAVTRVPGGELPRFEMKAKRWVRMA